MNTKNNAKNTCFVIALLFVVAVIFLFSIVFQMFNHTIKDIIGDFAWYLIYIVLPVLVVMISLTVRFLAKKSWKTTLIYVLILSILYSSAIIVTPVEANRYIQTFSADKWERYKSERWLMLDDLNKKICLVGMNINDAKNLLGTPDSESDHDIEYMIDEGWVDPVMLVLKIEEQKVSEIYTYREFKPEK